MASPRVYLFRHGRVETSDPEKLSVEGRLFRDELPRFFATVGVVIDSAFFDASVRRCQESLMRLDCAKHGYGVGREARTLNAVLASLNEGTHAVCCRGDSIESGQLYHVIDFELHTPFELGEHGAAARLALADSYHKVYCLEPELGRWRQRWARRVLTAASLVTRHE